MTPRTAKVMSSKVTAHLFLPITSQCACSRASTGPSRRMLKYLFQISSRDHVTCAHASCCIIASPALFISNVLIDIADKWPKFTSR